MFEEDAEEYTGKVHRYKDNLKELIQDEDVFDAFKDGAEFGYNKANEWHRLGKNPNGLPDEDVPVLCVRGGNIYVAWYSNNEWRGTRWKQVKKPYAWKEIVLAKEKE